MFPYLYAVNRPRKCHFQRSGRHFRTKFSCAPRQPLVARSAEILPMGCVPSAFLATPLLQRGIILRLYPVIFFSISIGIIHSLPSPHNSCARHALMNGPYVCEPVTLVWGPVLVLCTRARIGSRRPWLQELYSMLHMEKDRLTFLEKLGWYSFEQRS